MCAIFILLIRAIFFISLIKARLFIFSDMRARLFFSGKVRARLLFSKKNRAPPQDIKWVAPYAGRSRFAPLLRRQNSSSVTPRLVA